MAILLRAILPLPGRIKVIFLYMKSKVFIQTLHKSHDSHEISFSFDFNN